MKRTIPYGYEFRDGYIGVEKTASSVVRGIYIEYLNGKSFATIAKELTAKGIDYYQGKTEWNKQMVKRVLECPMYCGTEKYPQIIEEAQFKAVAKLIATKYGGYNNDARATVLRKRTFCQECGERIWHDMQHPKYRRWVCKKCNEHPIKDDDFYKKVTDILNAVIDHPELLDEVEPKDTYEYEYHKVGDGVEIVEEEAKIIREIFETYYAGASLQSICDMLNNRGVKAPGKKDNWYPSTLMTILRNEKYKGDIITQKTFCSDLLTHKREKNTGQLPQHYITDHHAAIVEREFFDRVQVEYARRNAKKVTHNEEEAPQKSKYSSKYALTELLVCGDCGCPYRRCTWSKNGQKKIVWRCTTRLEYGKSKCPESPTMEEEALHQAILKALSSLVENKDDVKDELKIALGNVLIDTGTDICIAHLEAQLKEQENDMMRVVRICAERGNQKDFEGEFKRINANITELRQIIEVEKTNIRPTLDIESRLDRLFEQITAASADIENFENSIIRQLVAQIRVESAEELTIILHNGFRTTAKI